MIKKLLLVCALASAVVSSALGAPLKVVYTTFIPQWNTLMSGSKPSLRVTLSDLAPVDTLVSLQASDTVALTVPATVTVPAGSRYGTVAMSVNGVDTDTVVTVKGSLDGFLTFATSPNLTILHSTFLRATLNVSTESVLYTGDPIELKVTVEGMAGPSGYVMQLDVDQALAPFIPAVVTVPAGQSVVRVPAGKFKVPNTGRPFYFGHIYIHLPDSPMIVDKAFLILPSRT